MKWFGIVLLSVFLVIPSANAAYVVDGDLSDWGITWGQGARQQGYLDINVPTSSPNVDCVTEDNASKKTQGWFKVGPGYTYGGPGYSGNAFDVEAMYFDNDQDNAYIAIVTGLPFKGATAPGNPWFLPGDIGISIGALDDYEYAVDVSSYKRKNSTARLYHDALWNDSAYSQHSEADPWAIRAKTGDNKGRIDFVYSGNQYSHRVLEACIPLASLGIDPKENTEVNIHWAMQCGNDYLNLNADVDPAAVPEPATMLLLGPALLGLAGYRKRK
ncbi:MAG: PEP-CTERM sorting domain-containing protein [PVC group bacterium]|nr:PEP-CTERM sorting domain-containing protein [PVC group bacterium]